nr:MAG TPA: hypothetical protein [Inoviridae sp.]
MPANWQLGNKLTANCQRIDDSLNSFLIGNPLN